MITFTSVAHVSLTCIDGEVFGEQVCCFMSGLSPTFGMLCQDMNFKTFTMKIYFNGGG